MPRKGQTLFAADVTLGEPKKIYSMPSPLTGDVQPPEEKPKKERAPMSEEQKLKMKEARAAKKAEREAAAKASPWAKYFPLWQIEDCLAMADLEPCDVMYEFPGRSRSQGCSGGC